ncbi:MAG: 2Fe-2S iron-sulfur cluster binding domain-containing protein [Kiritimatiellae bacterium]|nr:2Fe-2S iron-sulfur cluster binding domain-containing protein [Kiritimatiellia bacterium]
MEKRVGQKTAIIINESREITAKSGISLLQALKDADIFVPSACGGRGICGLCRVQVTEGAPADFTTAERTQISAEEQQNNVRLACQIMLYQAGGKTDRKLRVSIPEAFLSARPYTAVVSELRDLTRDIREVRLALSRPASISFKSGQYIQMRIPPYAGNKKTVYRAYSIASPPSQNKSLELVIRRIPRGIGTTYVFEHLKKGNRVVFSGPHGDFFLRATGREIVMIAGGAGMAPMKSILADMREKKINRRSRYFFGVRSPADVFYAGPMRELETALPDFKFIPSAANAPAGKKWEGAVGLVTETLARELQENFAGEVYLCGSPAMIEACLKILRQKKIPAENIFYDKFS